MQFCKLCFFSLIQNLITDLPFSNHPHPSFLRWSEGYMPPTNRIIHLNRNDYSLRLKINALLELDENTEYAILWKGVEACNDYTLRIEKVVKPTKLGCLILFWDKFWIPPPSRKECNYILCASKSSSRLTKFLINIIHIYGSKIIYYKNTFRN